MKEEKMRMVTKETEWEIVVVSDGIHEGRREIMGH